VPDVRNSRPHWFKEKWWQSLKPKDVTPWWQQFKLRKDKPIKAKLCTKCGAISLRKVIEKNATNFSVYFECMECGSQFILTGKGLIPKQTYGDGRFKSVKGGRSI
jgi:DNA-directed RNA polymerase subunit RPC12/RpoP